MEEKITRIILVNEKDLSLPIQILSSTRRVIDADTGIRLLVTVGEGINNPSYALNVERAEYRLVEVAQDSVTVIWWITPEVTHYSKITDSELRRAKTTREHINSWSVPEDNAVPIVVTKDTFIKYNDRPERIQANLSIYTDEQLLAEIKRRSTN